MFTRPRLGVSPEKQGEILNQIAELLDQGKIRSTKTDSMSWEDVQEAHRRIETEHTLGKLVMTVE
jgi:NADPH:quinone reductase-like Zn-dependent oxidoreductase